MSGGVPRPTLVRQERVLDAAKEEVAEIAHAELVLEGKRLRKAIDGAAGLLGAGASPRPEDVQAMLADCARFIDAFLEQDPGPRGPRKAGPR